MNAYDFSPLFRSGIGFDRMMNALERAGRSDDNGYPPYDIVKTGENRYLITVVAPGLNPGEFSIEARENVLTVTATPADVEGERTYLHQGISRRGFTRTFQLADHVVVGGARLENGLLQIELSREVPEALKPRKIEIQRSALTDNAVGTSQDAA